MFVVLGVTAMAYSMEKDESRECFDLIDEALELLKDDPPIGSKEEAEKWALGMYMSNTVKKACISVVRTLQCRDSYSWAVAILMEF